MPKVPGLKCPLRSWDIPGCPELSILRRWPSPRSQMSLHIPGYPRMSRLVQPKTMPKVPGLKCPFTSRDIPGCPELSILRRWQVPGLKCPFTSRDIPGCPNLSYLEQCLKSQVSNVPSGPGISWYVLNCPS